MYCQCTAWTSTSCILNKLFWNKGSLSLFALGCASSLIKGQCALFRTETPLEALGGPMKTTKASILPDTGDVLLAGDDPLCPGTVQAGRPWRAVRRCLILSLFLPLGDEFEKGADRGTLLSHLCVHSHALDRCTFVD